MILETSERRERRQRAQSEDSLCVALVNKWYFSVDLISVVIFGCAFKGEAQEVNISNQVGAICWIWKRFAEFSALLRNMKHKQNESVQMYRKDSWSWSMTYTRQTITSYERIHTKTDGKLFLWCVVPWIYFDLGMLRVLQTQARL